MIIRFIIYNAITMRKSLLLLCFSSYLFSACCRKVDCTERHTIPISFVGFSPEELDTIYTTGYERGSAFTNVVKDKLRDSVQEDGSNYILMHEYPSGLNTGESDNSLYDLYEWELYIPSVNRTIRIFNYQYAKIKCSACYPVERADRIVSLNTCNVNDSVMRARDVVVYR